MKKKHSYFKNGKEDLVSLENWVFKLEQSNGYEYTKISIETSLGKTQVYGFNVDKVDLETLIIFPGFRTTSLLWDLDKGLQALAKHTRLFLVETNGQPNLSDGYSPSIKNLDYGKWGAEVFEKLNVESAFIAGASFGGLVCMKIALVIPEKIKSAILLNPGCFRMISFGIKNLYFNLLPVINTSHKNIKKFLDEIVFHKPNHALSESSENLLTEYLFLAISRHKDNTEKPYYMGDQLNDVSVETHILVGENDILIPPKKSIENAKKHLKKNLKNIEIFENAGHGIECFKPSIAYIDKIIKARKEGTEK